MSERQIECKLVYCGPGIGGKTTNVQRIHDMVPAAQRGEFRQLPTVGERTLLFEFMPLDLGVLNGYKLKMKLFTLSGQAFYVSLQKAVLRDADGLAFVADSDPLRQDANRVAMMDLFALMADMGKPITPDFPLVIQYNKRDLPNPVPIADMEAALNPWGVPAFGAVANDSVNVMETLKALSRRVALDIATKGIK